MTILHSITLANTRRFAENVRIDFGPGATILLAPNGTGKTTVFEAIELALTGTISRLSENLAPFVREEKAQAFVRLEFGEGLSRTAILDRGQSPALSGNLRDLLGSVETKDVPYLLRLTHLLDQHDRRWFVEAKSDDAGNQLAALPIGKDGVRASGVLISAKKALTEKRRETERGLNDAKDNLSKWQKLISARENSTVDLGRPLIPLEELLKRLRPLSVGVGAKVPDEAMLVALSDTLVEIASLTGQQIESLQARAGSLAKGDNLLAAFLTASQALGQAQSLLSRSQATKLEREEGLTKAQAILDESDLALQVHQNSCRQLAELQQRLDSLANAKAQETAKEETLIQAAKAIAAAEQALLDASNSHRVAQQAADLHGQLRSRAESLIRLEKELATAGEMLARWVAHLGEIGNLEAAIKSLEAEIKKLAADHRKAIDELKSRQQSAEEARHAFDEISRASDAIREAISTIALQLPKDRDGCPLCGHVHGAAELQRRMVRALQAMDPALGPAAERVEQSRGFVAEADKVLESLKPPLTEAQSELAKSEARRAELLSEIEEIRSQPIFIGCDIPSARNAITARAIELETLRRDLTADQSAAPAEPKPELLAKLIQDIRTAVTALESAKARHGEGNSALRLAQDHRRAAEEAMGESKVADGLAPRLAAVETAMAQATTAVEEARFERDRRRVARDEADAEVRRGEELVSGAAERVDELRARWSGIPLEGEPAAETLAAAKLHLSEAQSKTENSRKELQTIRTELARWEAAETFHRAQREVTEFRGDSSDEAFTTRLEYELAAAETEVTRVSKGTSALDTFSSLLKKECDEANRRVGAVAPLWKTLLNRVVRDPRFAETNLEVSNRYNKQHAKTMVSLHGKQTEVLAVASEAQMTDLQLTFLLAMAQQHHWSPWRALLLDDPTQHHDLVHASAVFDLLRDYIADYGFQIVIATHDALQARFFMRKLENDGIASRLWTLKPTDAGVNAFLDR